MVHRDLKPANVLLAACGVATAKPQAPLAKIADFGLAKQLDVDSGQTRTGAVIGTPSYMAPEQAAGLTKEIGPAVDVYALGAILYEMLTGRPPFRGSSVFDTLEQVRTREPVPPTQLVPSVPRNLETICLKCLQKEPAKRYTAAADLAEDLRRFLAGEPIAARRTPLWERGWKWAKRRPALAALAGVSAVGVVAVVILAIQLLASNAELSHANIDLDQQKTRALLALDEKGTAQRLAQDRAVRLSVGNGVRLLSDGDLFAALPWFVAARRDDRHDPPDPDDAVRDAVHQARIESTVWQCPRLAQVWSFDQLPIAALFSPDGSRLAVVLADRVVIYDMEGRQQAVLPSKGYNRQAVFFPDSRRLVIASALPSGTAGEIRVWDLEANQVRVTFSIEGEVMLARPSPDGSRLLTVAAYQQKAQTGGGEASWVEEARVWDANTGRPISPPVRHAGGLLMLGADATEAGYFSPDGRWVLNRSEREIHVWDAVSGQPRFPPLRYTQSMVLYAGFSRDGHSVISSGAEADGFGIHIWDAASGRRLLSIPTGWPAADVAESPSGRWLVAVGGHEVGRAAVWDLPSGRQYTLPWRIGSDGKHIALSPDDRWVLTTDASGAARIWWVGSAEPVTPPLRFPDRVVSASFRSDGRYVLGAGSDGTVRLWDLVPARPAMTMMVGQVHPVDAANHNRVTSEGRLITVRSLPATAPNTAEDGEVQVWEGSTGRALGSPISVKSGFELAALSADGHRLAVAGLPGGLTMIDPIAGRTLFTWPGDSRVVVGFAFVAERRLATLGLDGQCGMWDADTGAPVATLARCGESARDAAFSADGRRVATLTGLNDGTIQVWNASSGEPVGPPLQSESQVEAALNADGTRLLVWDSIGRHDGAARLWEVATGRPLTPPLRIPGMMKHAALSPDGRCIAATDGEKLVVWEVATSEPILTQRNYSGLVIDRITFSADSRSLWLAAGKMKLAVEKWPAVAHVPLVPFGLSVEDAERWAHALAGRRVEGSGIASLTGAELTEVWAKVTAAHPELRTASAKDVEQWRIETSEALERAGAWAAAIDRLDPVIAARPHESELLDLRGRLYALQGRWKEAAADFVRATEEGAAGLSLWKHRLRTQQAADDREACRATCSAILQRFGKTDKAAELAEIIWSCAVVPDGVADSAALLRLVDRAAAAAPKSDLRSIRGIALYRAGRLDDAEALLRPAEKAHAPGLPAIYWCFLGLIAQRHGHADEARDWLDKATRWAEGLPKTRWEVRLEMKLLREECEGLAAKKKP